MADYQRGTGPTQLPQGGAAQANASVPAPAPGPDLTQAPQPVDIPVAYANAPSKVDTKSPTESPKLDLLTGPSDPNFIPPTQGPNRVPRNIARNLPVLYAAAKDPEAPPSILAMYRGAIYKLEEESRQD